MPLEEALELFESGVKLSRQCQSTLDAAERRVEILVADRGSKASGENVIDFDSEQDADDESAFED
jgi:exodeoxyribonuclease VII small subunit